MDRANFIHQPKSVDAYAYNETTFHVRLKSRHGSCHSIQLLWGDGFEFRFEGNLHKWVSQRVVMEKVYETKTYDYWFIAIHPFHKRIKYGFVIDDAYLLTSRDLLPLSKWPTITYDNQFWLYQLFNFPWMNEADLFKAPQWVESTIWYQVFPDSFRKDHSDFSDHFTQESFSPFTTKFHGGTLKGITEKLDYLVDLGITGIYLTPIFESRTQHRYDTVNYFEVDSRLGTKADLKELVDSAHQRGLKVMLDAVFNHTSYYHPFFLDVVRHQKESKYYPYYCFFQDPPINFDVDESLNPVNMRAIYERIHTEGPFLSFHSFAFGHGMPKTNVDYPPMRQHLLDAGCYWIKEFDIDGWRLDVANEVSHDFWRDFRKACKAIKPDCFILGENWYDSEPWLRGDQFDGSMNFDLMFSLVSFLSAKPLLPYSANQFRDQLIDYVSRYSHAVLPYQFNLLDCHDTERFLSLVDGNLDLFKLSFVLLFALPGAPVIYYGDEIGIGGEGPRGNREPMIWDESKQNRDLFAFFKSLIAIRKQEPSFSQPSFELPNLTNDSVLTLVKGPMILSFNRSDQKQTIDLPFACQYDVWNHKDFKHPIVQRTLAPYGFSILK